MVQRIPLTRYARLSIPGAVPQTPSRIHMLYNPAPPRRTPTFHDFFPYERSADGSRARVGWVQRMEVH